MKETIIDKEIFDDIKEICYPYIKDYCNYCGCKIDKNSFGYLSRDITCCKSIICISQAIEDEEISEDFHSNIKSKDWVYPDDWDSNKKSKQEKKE